MSASNVLYKDAEQKQQAFWTRTLRLLDEYRGKQAINKDACNIDEGEWFRKIFTDAEYQAFCNWKFEFTRDISDAAVERMTEEKYINMVSREIFRLNYGLWIPTEEWHSISEEERNVLAETEPLKYHVQVMPADHYYLMNYHREMVSHAAYFRYDCMYWQMHSALCEHKLSPREEREGLFVRKARFSRFSTRWRGSAMRKMLVKKEYTMLYCIPVAEEMDKFTDPFPLAYESLPTWLKPRLPNPNYRPGRQTPEYIDYFRITGTKHEKIIRCYPIGPDNKPLSKPNIIACYGSKSGKFNGYRAKEAFIEEVGMMENDLSSVYDELNACLLGADGQSSGRIGFMLVGGTSAAIATKNNDTLAVLGANPSAYNMHSLFSGFEYTLSGYLNDYGWVMKEDVFKKWNEDLARVEATGISKKIINFLRLYPTQPKHCHYTGSSDAIDPLRLERHRDALSEWESLGYRIVVGQDGNEYKEPFVIKRGWFKEGENELKPEFKPAANGGWYIYQTVQEDLARRDLGRPSFGYIAASDNADAVIDDAKELARIHSAKQGAVGKSMMCMVVMHVDSKETHALYHYRHGNPEMDYEQMRLGALYYNCYLMPEINKVGQLTYMMQGPYNGRYKSWLLPNPRKFRPQLGGNQSQFGYYTNENKESLYQDVLLPFVSGGESEASGEVSEGEMERIYFDVILEALGVWDINDKDYTPDCGMAYLLCIVARKFLLETWSKVPRIRGISADNRNALVSLIRESKYNPLTVDKLR